MIITGDDCATLSFADLLRLVETICSKPVDNKPCKLILILVYCNKSCIFGCAIRV